ncbi:TIGR01212 family radical SAM protein [Desulfonatronovibrio hydrogenovorans]|uniref:TIGR01212 family radical SAM protein n=1 Tax=Desulfonatronovibrio hydrogenovorans TaxID=53245 RepID=UPI00068B5B1F|nr:TIGR01212 family radical SAM protein [Desulfonatronovibrio hydrogenovorans]
MHPYLSLSRYWKKKFGTRIQRIPLDAGLSCPNRDGTISYKGCIFCNEQGSGTGLQRNSVSLKDQYNLFRKKLLQKYGPIRFAAYLQSFTNTHCDSDRLQDILDQLKELPDLDVLCIGTRPDCLDKEKLRIIASFPCREIWLDLGLQSSKETTLRFINRGHLAEDFSRACHLAHQLDIKVCAHVIAGLPEEDLKDFLETIAFLNNLPVNGIKFHNLYVCKKTELARIWSKKEYTPLTLDQYVSWIVRAICFLRPDLVIHRLTGDPAKGELLAPDWAVQKNLILNKINQSMVRDGLWQGSLLPVSQLGWPVTDQP